jgi:hypothetical protein
VEVRLAAATAMLERRKAAEGDAVLGVLRAVSESVSLTTSQRLHRCPVCESSGIATGDHGVEWVPTDWDKETG